MISGNPKIRNFQPEDLEACLNLWEEFDHTHLSDSDLYFRLPGREESILRHNRYTTGKDYMLFLREEKDEITGFICGQIRMTPAVALLRERRQLELHAIIVHKPWRKGSSANELLQAAIRFAEQNDIKDVVTHIWTFNHQAASLVEKFNFKAISRKFCLTLDRH